MKTTNVTPIQDYDTFISTPETSTLDNTESIIPVIISVVDSMVDDKISVCTFSFQFKEELGTGFITNEALDVDLKSVVEAIFTLPETNFQIVDTDVEHFIVQGIENYFGVIPKTFFLKLGNKGYLKINDKFLRFS